MRMLILGSKEYPFGVTDDKQASGGMEIYVQELARNLTKKNITPIIVTRKFKQSKTYEVEKGIELRRVPWIRGMWFRGPSFIFFSFLKSLSLKYDVILANGLMATTISFVLAKLRGKPLVCVPHGTVSTQDRYGKLVAKSTYFMEKMLYSKASLVVLSEEDKKKIKRLFNIDKVTIIPTGIDVSSFNPNKKPKSKLMIACVGRLTKVKGIDYLLPAIAKLKGNFKIVFTSSGSEEKLYKQMTAQLKIGDKVEFLGFVPSVKPIHENADIYTLPSLSEGLPVSLLEAMAAGCACVVTDIGLPVTDGKNALVVPPANSEKLAIALQRLIDNQTLRKELGKSARAFAEQFSWEKTASKYVELFNSITKQKA